MNIFKKFFFGGLFGLLFSEILIPLITLFYAIGNKNVDFNYEFQNINIIRIYSQDWQFGFEFSYVIILIIFISFGILTLILNFTFNLLRPKTH